MSERLDVLRLGYRRGRDPRITTHLALVSRAMGALTPFIDLSYASEDTTSASYNTEITTDGFDDAAASDPDAYFTVGAGINLNLRGKLSGSIMYIETMDRDDYEENTVSATLKLSF